MMHERLGSETRRARCAQPHAAGGREGGREERAQSVRGALSVRQRPRIRCSRLHHSDGFLQYKKSSDLTVSAPYCNRKRPPKAGAVPKVGRNIASWGRGTGAPVTAPWLISKAWRKAPAHYTRSRLRASSGSLGVSEGQVSHRGLGLVTRELWKWL